jgi:uncharacterized protein YndB with AHSA1/START domain
MENQKITVHVNVKKDIEHVWELWNEPEHIVKWNHASDDWQTVRAENDLKIGGKFLYRMEAKDGSFGFDFEALYDHVIEKKELSYTMIDGRKATTIFQSNGFTTYISTTFDAETENPIDLQKLGWQAILNNFKKYAEI